MRRTLVIVLAVLVLIAIDAVFNGWQVSGAVYREIQEFGRLLTRTLQGGF